MKVTKLQLITVCKMGGTISSISPQVQLVRFSTHSTPDDESSLLQLMYRNEVEVGSLVLPVNIFNLGGRH